MEDEKVVYSSPCSSWCSRSSEQEVRDVDREIGDKDQDGIDSEDSFAGDSKDIKKSIEHLNSYKLVYGMYILASCTFLKIIIIIIMTTLIADLAIRGIWLPQAEAWFDVRVIDTDAQSYNNCIPRDVLKTAENEKETKYSRACEDRRAQLGRLQYRYYPEMIEFNP